PAGEQVAHRTWQRSLRRAPRAAPVTPRPAAERTAGQRHRAVEWRTAGGATGVAPPAVVQCLVVTCEPVNSTRTSRVTTPGVHTTLSAQQRSAVGLSGGARQRRS